MLGYRKRQASGAEYFELEFPSAFDLAGDNRHSIKCQGQIFDVDEKGRTSAVFKDITPLVANGRCAMTRCAAALVHPSIGSAVEDLKVPASELTAQDWDLYHNCAEILPYYWKLEADLQSNMTWVLKEALTAADLSKISPVGNTDGAVVGLGIAPWIGVVEFKRTQETAEVQLARYVRDQLAIFNAQPTVAWQTTASPCAALEIVGNEMRLKAFWFETTVCAANLGAAEVRLDSTLEQRRAGAALLRAWLRLLGALHRFQLEGVVQQEGLQDLLRTGVPYALAYNDRFTGIFELRKHRV
ncbi:g7074 [Coccomyxa elongata]